LRHPDFHARFPRLFGTEDTNLISAILSELLRVDAYRKSQQAHRHQSHCQAHLDTRRSHLMARRGRAAVKTVTDIDAQIATLEARKRALQAQEAERLRLCAERVGLNTIDFSEPQLEAAFKDLAARCREPAPVASDVRDKPDRAACATATPRD
jgi:hypothetical protein